MDSGAPQDVTTAQVRPACTECSRRKQKCNREWPCNQCQKRKLADKCSFKPSKSSPLDEFLPGNQPADVSVRVDSDLSPDPEDGELDYNILGYMTDAFSRGFGLDSQGNKSGEVYVEVNSCPQLKHALDVLPGRQNMDALIENFLQTVNFHYYIVYPRIFLEEYQDWWTRKEQGERLSVQYTCLLLMVCACTMQHLDPDTRRMLELDWGDTAQHLTESYHTAGRELGSVVPVGYYHMLNVQQLLHSCYWYKSEAKFLECWHVLSAAVREAQELGFHKEASVSAMGEFDREIAKRIWCIINCWDWQVSSGLMRPTIIIDRTDCDVGLPALTLETYSPHPLQYMKMQSGLINQLGCRFVVPKNVVTPSDVHEYRAMIEAWMSEFPAVFAFENPDRSLDETYTWIPFHRYYLYTMAYLMLLNPIRAYMAEETTAESPDGKVDIRREGVNYSLDLLSTLQAWLEIITHRDGRFHFIIFALLDTALSLSNAIIHDLDNSLPKKMEVYDAIYFALSMLKRLKALSSTAKSSHDVLHRLVKNIPRPDGSWSSEPAKRKKIKIGKDEATFAVKPSLDQSAAEPQLAQEVMALFETGEAKEGSVNTAKELQQAEKDVNLLEGDESNGGGDNDTNVHTDVFAFNPKAPSFTMTGPSLSEDCPGGSFYSSVSEGAPVSVDTNNLLSISQDFIMAHQGLTPPVAPPFDPMQPIPEQMGSHVSFQAPLQPVDPSPGNGFNWNWESPTDAGFGNTG